MDHSTASEDGISCSEISTFAHAVRSLSRTSDRGFTFLRSDGTERRLNFAEIAFEAARRGRHLLSRGLRRGDHLALIIPESDEFVLSFLAALRVGIVPVPMYPPVAFGKLDSYIASTAQILEAADARMLLTTRKTQSVLWSLIDRVKGLNDLVLVESLEGPGPGSDPDPDQIRPDDVAFLQFTSGSTAAPKGVMVTHRSLEHNCHAVVKGALQAGPGDKGISWLPMYHDMGLIGCVLGPVRAHLAMAFIPTLDFVKHPSIWMETMHRQHGTLTFAPNFAFAIAARRTSDEVIARLDLSHVKAIGCGAEPIHPGTLRTFVERFRPAGLRPEAILPSYGMAEATLAMSFCRLDASFHTDRIDVDPYQAEGRAVPLESAASTPPVDADGDASVARGLELVSCGRALPGHAFTIIDAAGNPLPDRHVGEVVFQGPSIAAGYYKNPEATRAAFTPHGLRTGDVGYLADGEVYLTGRKKDILILNGRNYDPQSIEWEAAEVPGIRQGNVIAFSRPGAASEELVLVAETRIEPAEHEPLKEAVRRRVQESLYLRIADVVLLAPGQLPKTTSGKLQRSRTRQQYLEGRTGGDGIRTMGEQGQTLVLARHLAKSFVSRVKHGVKSFRNEYQKDEGST